MRAAVSGATALGGVQGLVKVGFTVLRLCWAVCRLLSVSLAKLALGMPPPASLGVTLKEVMLVPSRATLASILGWAP